MRRIVFSGAARLLETVASDNPLLVAACRSFISSSFRLLMNSSQQPRLSDS